MAEYVYYRLDSLGDLKRFPTDGIQPLDWARDLEMIKRFYRQWGDGDDDIQPPGEDEPEIGQPIALVEDGEILSFTSYWYFREGEAELGAIATLPGERGKGHCRRVISEAARRALERGLVVTLTTGEDNRPMQAAAEAIGMRRTNP